VRLLDQLVALPDHERNALIDSLSEDEARQLLYDWEFWARPKQLPPPGDWFIWLILTGRGFGKTRTGVEWVRQQVALGYSRIALVAETAADARDVIVEGESGILATAPPWNRPKYEPSKRRVTWNNGAIATTYSGDEPDQLRGPQHDKALVDEWAKYKYPAETLSNLLFGLRLGDNPQALIATTPRPIPPLIDLLNEPTTVATRGSLYENIANLPASFISLIKSKYEGTRLGRQEIGGEILDDNPNALWNREAIEAGRVTQAPSLFRIVVAVDPSGNEGADSTSESANECGIVTAGVAGAQLDKRELYVLGDSSGMMTPTQWAKQAVADYHRFDADAIVAESNFGGAMVKAIIRSIDPNVPVRLVHASRGKHIRAEPVAALYEQGRGHHVGMFATLEDEMVQWEPGSGTSPNRVDALVWAGTDLILAPPKQDKPKRKRAYGL
jgi:phage terminase large subunit-like protein